MRKLIATNRRCFQWELLIVCNNRNNVSRMENRETPKWRCSEALVNCSDNDGDSIRSIMGIN